MTRRAQVAVGIGSVLLVAAGIVFDRLLALAAIAAVVIVGLAVGGMVRRQALGAFVFGWAMVVIAVAAAILLLLSGVNPSPYASRDPDPAFNPVKLLVLVILPVAIGAAVMAFRFGRSLKRSSTPPAPR